MAIVTSKDNLPEVGEVVDRVEIGDDNVADIYFKGGKVMFVHFAEPSPAPDLIWDGQWVFSCVECGDQEDYALPDGGGGVTEEEAETLGWRKVDGEWICPFCSGSKKSPQKFFKNGPKINGECVECKRPVGPNTPGLSMRRTILYRCGDCAPLAGNDPEEDV